MPPTIFRKLKKLANQRFALLSPHLTYHSIDHSLDVVKQCVRIGALEKIGDEDLALLQIAALYHDTGFLYTYLGHEEKSCEILLADITGMDLTRSDVKVILGLIMATKVPQKPKTLMQRIICDADLDYLGRSDFADITQRLKNEFLYYSIVKDEIDWKNVQRNFLKKHHYHTASSMRRREPIKQINLSRLD